eukprot:COSAG02_NODE_961_length_15629_cov_2.747650_2_plen_63_part_00
MFLTLSPFSNCSSSRVSLVRFSSRKRSLFLSKDASRCLLAYVHQTGSVVIHASYHRCLEAGR